MIIQCTKCATKLRVPDSSAGKKARCPNCSAVIDVDPVVDVIADVQPDPEPPSPPRPKPKPAAPAEKKRPSGSAEQPAQRRSRPASGRDSAPAGPSKKKASRAADAERPAKTPAKKKKKRKKKQEPAYDTFGFDDEELYGYDDIQDYEDEYNPYASSSRPAAKPRRRSSSSASASGGGGGSTAGLGLLMLAWGITILVVGSLLSVVLIIAVPPIGGLMALLVAVGGGLSLLIGQFLCLTAPSTSARVLVGMAMACQVAQFVINFSMRANRGQPQTELAVLGSVLSLAAVVLFQLFLKTMADYVGRSDLSSRAMVQLVGFSISAILAIVGTLMVAGNRELATPALIAFGIAGLIALVMAILQIFVMFQLGHALRSSGAGGTSVHSRSSRGSAAPARSRSSRGRYVTFSYTISIVVMTFKMNSAPVRVGKGEGTFFKALPYTLITLVLGWWGIPWGPIYSIMSIVENSSGGTEVG